MITDFDKFEKTNSDIDELKSIRVKNLNIFKKKGFPTKREENWKYADLKAILAINLNKLEIPSNNVVSNYNSEWLLKDFEHNKIILVNGNFVSSNFHFENQEKIIINPLQKVLKDKKVFNKIKSFFFQRI